MQKGLSTRDYKVTLGTLGALLNQGRGEKEQFPGLLARYKEWMAMSSPNAEYIAENEGKSAGQDLAPVGCSFHCGQNYSNPRRNCFLLNKRGTALKDFIFFKHC